MLDLRTVVVFKTGSLVGIVGLRAGLAGALPLEAGSLGDNSPFLDDFDLGDI